MRSRERLMTVLWSVNDNAPGVGPTIGFALRMAANALSEMRPLSGALVHDITRARDHHPSPHIREMAAEALHYLKEDAHG